MSATERGTEADIFSHPEAVTMQSSSIRTPLRNLRETQKHNFLKMKKEGNSRDEKQ